MSIKIKPPFLQNKITFVFNQLIVVNVKLPQRDREEEIAFDIIMFSNAYLWSVVKHLHTALPLFLGSV